MYKPESTIDCDSMSRIVWNLELFAHWPVFQLSRKHLRFARLGEVVGLIIHSMHCGHSDFFPTLSSYRVCERNACTPGKNETSMWSFLPGVQFWWRRYATLFRNLSLCLHNWVSWYFDRCSVEQRCIPFHFFQSCRPLQMAQPNV